MSQVDSHRYPEYSNELMDLEVLAKFLDGDIDESTYMWMRDMTKEDE